MLICPINLVMPILFISLMDQVIIQVTTGYNVAMTCRHGDSDNIYVEFCVRDIHETHNTHISIWRICLDLHDFHDLHTSHKTHKTHRTHGTRDSHKTYRVHKLHNSHNTHNSHNSHNSIRHGNRYYLDIDGDMIS